MAVVIWYAPSRVPGVSNMREPAALYGQAWRLFPRQQRLPVDDHVQPIDALGRAPSSKEKLGTVGIRRVLIDIRRGRHETREQLARRADARALAGRELQIHPHQVAIECQVVHGASVGFPATLYPSRD